MRFGEIKLTGYAGIYQGTLKKELYIDFTKCKNRIITIIGDNGSGKSTLLRSITIFPDNNDEFLIGEYAEKSGTVIDGDSVYFFSCQHQVRSKVVDGEVVYERLPAKAYIKKSTPNGMVELNPAGTIGSYKDVLMSEFNLDPNFVTLSYLSTENKGIVERTPAERRKYVGPLLQSVEVYNNILKALNKRNSINKGFVNNISSKIRSVGTEEHILESLESVKNRIDYLTEQKNLLIKDIAERDASIKLLDPDGSIQTLYTSIEIELQRIDREINRCNTLLNYQFSDDRFTAFDDIEKALKHYNEYSTSINVLKSKVEELESTIQTLFSQREEEGRAIQLKTQRLVSLRSEINYTDIEKSMELYTSNIKEYEAIFEKIHIKNALSISKDEYVTGLTTMKSIKDTIDAFRSSGFSHIIKEAVIAVRDNVDLISEINLYESQLKDVEDNIEVHTQAYNALSAKIEAMSVLSKRPKSCKIDSCEFIRDALELSKTNPQEELEYLGSIIEDLSKDRMVVKNILEELNQTLVCSKELAIIIRTIDNNSAIISKLPNGYIFSKPTVFDKLLNDDPFLEIDELYQYINYANIFEEYKLAKDTLYKLEVEYKIYESKNEVIIELEKDIEVLDQKLSSLVSTIESTNATIREYKETIAGSDDYLSTLDLIIVNLNKRNALENEKNECLSKLETIATNMEKIKLHLQYRDHDLANLNDVEKALAPLNNERDSLNYNLTSLAQYKEELEIHRASYDKIEILKKYSNPSEKGIQNLFIKVYMNQTLGLANEILSKFFNSRMTLLRFDTQDGAFSIPCYSSYSNMEVDDVSRCSRSEKCMASLAMSTAMQKQSSTKYNVLKLDELDEGLDSTNRLAFIQNLFTITDVLEIEQCIMVSHTIELELGAVDIIELRRDTPMESEGNYIFRL